MSVAQLLKDWYFNNHRLLPWRETKNPYKIWLSEVILQQTRVQQGLAYYHEFIRAFPTVFSLAKADEQEVLKLWQGLGYYSRARNLHHTAKQVVEDYGGAFPDSYAGLLKLKGVGPYTAAAIASFAFNERVAVVDGNVYRVLSRLFNDSTPIDSTQGKKNFQVLADSLLPQESSDIHNQAMMELGALVCTPQSPQCTNCPIESRCHAFMRHNPTDLPVKSKKTKVEHRDIHYVVSQKSGHLLLRKRTAKGIWQNLYDFPESSETPGSAPLYTTQHQLTHRKLHLHFYEGNADHLQEMEGDWTPLDQVRHLPVPVPIADFLAFFLSENSSQ